jgi:hypothetical protein
VHAPLQLPVLGDVLDHEVGPGQGGDVAGGFQAREDGGGLGVLLVQQGGELEVLGDAAPRSLEWLVADVDEHDVVAGLREQLGDARADHPRAHHPDPPEPHRRTIAAPAAVVNPLGRYAPEVSTIVPPSRRGRAPGGLGPCPSRFPPTPGPAPG